MATLSDTAITRFVRYVTLGELPARARTATLQAPNLIFRETERAPLGRFQSGRDAETMPTFYSYGTHFPLARFVRAKRGRAALWVINGDVWPRRGWSSTSDHQDATRRAIADAIADAAKLGKTIGSVVIPMSALDGAGVDYASIRPHEVRADWTEKYRNTVWLPLGLFTRPLPSRETAETVARASDPRGRAVQMSENLAPSTSYSVARESVNVPNRAPDTWQVSGAITRAIVYAGYSYRQDAETGQWGSVCEEYAEPLVTVWLNGSHALAADLGNVRDVDGVPHVSATFETSRHWLGDCVFSANVRSEARAVDADGHTDWKTTLRRYRFVSSFDYNEPRPLYYLAALPAWSRAKTVDEAVSDLAPASVHAARAAGLEVLRQGDIFAIPTKMDTATLDALGATRVRLTMWTREARAKRGELGYAVAPTVAQMATFKENRRALVLAAMRANVARDTRPTTPSGYRSARRMLVAAIETAKTATYLTDPRPLTERQAASEETYRARQVARAETALRAYDAAGRANARAIGYCSTEPAYRKLGKCYRRALAAWNAATDTERAKIVPPYDGAAIRAALCVYGTGHTATHVATLPSGATYVRGTMRHRPDIAGEARTADHIALPLGDGEAWYLAVRNTVPRA